MKTTPPSSVARSAGIRRSTPLVAALAAVMMLSVVLALRSCGEDGGAFAGARLEVEGMRLDLRTEGSRLVFALASARAPFPPLPLALRLREGTSTSPLRLGHAFHEGERLVAPVILPFASVRGAARLVLTPTAGRRAVRVDLELDEALARGRSLALAVEAPIDGRRVFVGGVGELADSGDAHGDLVVLGEDPIALGITAKGGVSTSLSPEAGKHVGAPRILRVVAPSLEDRRSTLVFALSDRTQAIYGALWAALGVKTERVHGVVGRGGADRTAPRTRLYALDEAGKTRLRAVVSIEGRFEVDVPPEVNRWYAAIDESRVSPPLFFAPGAAWDLKLDVSAGGALTVRVRDADGDAPLVARVAVRGIDGTLDPNFGPDYRASGAGPLVDMRTGEVVTPLPAGRYRVSATKGIEWSIDAKDVTVEPGGHQSVVLRPRHVAFTPEEVACDLHVHARPSFDSPVLPEDRVLSLASAGIDFAVPTEHNVVGDYGPAIELLDLSRELAWVPGVEVTTYSPRFGHFGVFPTALDGGVPRYRGTSAAALFAEVRRDARRVLQVNHPRLPKDIGYFEVAGFDPKEPRSLRKIRLDFDALEVYSGFDVHVPARVEAVLEDYYALLVAGRRVVATGSSDAHRIQYNWAGYPRTMVRTSAASAAAPLDVARIVEDLKQGRATVTSGPLIDLVVRPEDGQGDSGDSGAGGPVDEARPGGDFERRSRTTVAHVVVRAAPWVDVTDVALVADGQIVARAAVPSRPSVVGPEPGTLDEARARTLRYRGTLPIPTGARWVLAIARGTRKTDDVLAFMPVVPFAFTNPVWLRD